MSRVENPLKFLQDASQPGFGWEILSEGHVRLKSLEWQGARWVHDLWHSPGKGDCCLLQISGDLVEGADGPDFQRLVHFARMPVAALYGIPNQPYQDMREDDLMAHSFAMWLETQDRRWPLIFTMATAVIRAMDSLQDEFGYERFVLTGGSKRGWTAWMAALCGDNRVVGCAPMVFDNLNVPAQLAGQLDAWGGLSPRLDDYATRQLHEMLAVAPGQALAALIDPFSYLEHLRCSMMITNGTNDEFWTVDANKHYWDFLPEPKTMNSIPNVGHDLGDRRAAYATLGAFARSCAKDAPFPWLDVTRHEDGLSWHGSGLESNLTIWQATSPDWHFSSAVWEETATLQTGERFEISSTDRHVALMAQASFDGEVGPFNITSPVRVLAKA